MLRTTLSRLRRTLKDRWLVADRQTVGLDGSQEGAVDVLRFRSLLAQCHTHGHGVRETCPECLPPSTHSCVFEGHGAALVERRHVSLRVATVGGVVRWR